MAKCNLNNGIEPSLLKQIQNWTFCDIRLISLRKPSWLPHPSIEMIVLWEGHVQIGVQTQKKSTFRRPGLHARCHRKDCKQNSLLEIDWNCGTQSDWYVLLRVVVKRCSQFAYHFWGSDAPILLFIKQTVSTYHDRDMDWKYENSPESLMQKKVLRLDLVLKGTIFYLTSRGRHSDTRILCLQSVHA